MGLVRVLRTTAATLTHAFYVDETLTDLAAPPTVTVNRLDGTQVTTGTSTHTTTGVYTFTLPGGPSSPGSATYQLDYLVVTWAGTLAGAQITVTDEVEIVGGFYFGLAEARASDSSLADTVKYPTSLLALRRIQVEQEAEEIMERAWVPRFRRVSLPGTGRDVQPLQDMDIRTLRAASVAYLTGQTPQALTGSALSMIVVTAEGTLVRPANVPWPVGIGNVIVEYEYGRDFPPEGLRQAMLTRFRNRLNVTKSAIPDRVMSYTTSDGVSANTFRLSQPGQMTTGLPEVDAEYQRYASARGGFA
jgi:hypothetical protein